MDKRTKLVLFLYLGFKLLYTITSEVYIMKIAISSSSNDLIDDKYKVVARTVTRYLAEQGYDLVWGSGSSSIMGICYEEFARAGRKIYGFTSEKYVDDIENLPLAVYKVEKDTFDLKKSMFENSDAILFLAGGTGTVSEFFTDLEEVRSNDRSKILIAYNEDHSFDMILKLIEDLISKNFNSPSIYEYFKVANNMEELKEIFESMSNEDVHTIK